MNFNNETNNIIINITNLYMLPTAIISCLRSIVGNA